ncbi:MAG: nickel pincer cofactor biosynthesis protein LarC [Holdemanella sp.]|nr:nickel pincer cofactor biosynthesis protein LarC [Holdemanella sp.]
MKILFFDCASGISGNMTLGALMDLVENGQEYLVTELNKLNVDGYHIHFSKQNKNGILANYVDVHLEGHHHDHGHHHEHRNLQDVESIINQSEIEEEAKNLAKRIFMRVALAEAKVHGKPIEEVHFHEVGAIDSIVDIVGCAILITKIKPDAIYSSVVNDGYGFIECAHGTIPVPVPATCEIFANRKALTRQIDVPTELVTPTGAAIISELACSFGKAPVMSMDKIGYGCGSKDLPIPNVLRVMQGKMEAEEDTVTIIETNIDDTTPEVLSYTMEKLFEKGALDVFYTPIFMKKSRPAYRMNIICKNECLETMRDILFLHTTTIGMRYRKEKRFVLPREIVERDTPFGKVHFKKVTHLDNVYYYPEYEDVKKISNERNLSIKEVYRKL